MTAKPRKTIEIEKLLDYANCILASGVTNADERHAVSMMIQYALMEANRYRGFRYLEESELPPGQKPGIRWVDRVPGTVPDPRWEDTDQTRVRYA